MSGWVSEWWSISPSSSVFLLKQLVLSLCSSSFPFIHFDILYVWFIFLLSSFLRVLYTIYKSSIFIPWTISVECNPDHSVISWHFQAVYYKKSMVFMTVFILHSRKNVSRSIPILPWYSSGRCGVVIPFTGSLWQSLDWLRVDSITFLFKFVVVAGNFVVLFIETGILLQGFLIWAMEKLIE